MSTSSDDMIENAARLLRYTEFTETRTYGSPQSSLELAQAWTELARAAVLRDTEGKSE